MIGSPSLLEELGATAWSVVAALLPLAALFVIFQVFLLKLPRGDVRRILTGSALAAAGLFMFLLGVGIGFLPFGRAVGEALGALQQKWLLLPAGLLLGFVTTWSEPAVRILADQADDASNGAMPRSLVLPTVCIGVAVYTGLGMLRIGYEIPLLYLLVPSYALILVILWLSDKAFVAVAVDAGGVATGPLANTFLLALAFGTSAAIGNQDPVLHGLGLASMIAVAPIISMLTLGRLVRRKQARKEH